MDKFTILFKENDLEEWECLVLIDNEKNIIVDSIENHRLSVNDVLTLLKRYDILNIEIEREVIEND